MRMGELLSSEVRDLDGCLLGRVHDVHLIQDGPLQGRFGPALRIDGLVVGRAALAIRLGYHRAGVRGPYLLGRLFRALEGRARYVPWDVVAHRGEGRIDLSCRKDDLARIPDLG